MDPITFAGPIVLKSTIDSMTQAALQVLGGLRVLGQAQFDSRVELGTTDVSGPVPSNNNGVFFTSDGSTFVDSATAVNGTASAPVYFNSFLQPQLDATNAGVSTNEAATLFIEGSPQATGNQTVSQNYALLVQQGTVLFRDTTDALNQSTGSVSVLGGLGVLGTLTSSGFSASVATVSSLLSATTASLGSLDATGTSLFQTLSANVINATQANITTLNATTLVATNSTSVSSTSNNINVSGTASINVLLVQNALVLNTTQTSINSSTGALVIQGGFSIDSTAEATSLTAGGALTVRGGFGATRVYTQGLALNTTVGQTGVFTVGYNAGAAQMQFFRSDGNVGGTFFVGTDNLLAISTNSGSGRIMLQVNAAGTSSGLIMGSLQGTAVTPCLFRLTALGRSDTDANYDFLDIKTDGTGSYAINTLATGSATRRALSLGVNSNGNMVWLATDGSVAVTQGALRIANLAINTASTATNVLRLGYNSGQAQISLAGTDGTFAGSLFFNQSRDFVVSNNYTAGSLILQSGASGGAVALRDANVAPTVVSAAILRLATLGSAVAGETNFEYLNLLCGNTAGTVATTSPWSIQSAAGGTGILRPIEFAVGGALNQMLLQTDGSVVFGNTSITSINSTTGSVRIVNSLAILGTADATSVTAGGACTISGGLAVAKTLTAQTLLVNGVNVTPVAGSIAETSFSMANNQSSAANVTGLSFANTSVRAAHVHVSITIIATASRYGMQLLRLVQGASSWTIASDAYGDSTGIVFSVTNAGQVQYTSTNNAGFTSGTFKFIATALSV